MHTEPKSYSQYNCLNQSLALLLKNQKSDIKWIAVNSFSVEYTTKLDKNLVFKKLRSRQVVHYTKFCEIVYGMKFEEIKFNEKVFSVMREKLQKGKAVLVGFDSYYVPWNEASGKTHVFHYCLIDSIEGDDLICIDAYMNNAQYTWNKELFMKAVKTGYYVEIPDDTSIVNYNKVIKLMIENMTEYSIQKNYLKLIHDLHNVDRLEQLFENDNPRICEIIVIVKRIAADYGKTAELFQYEGTLFDTEEQKQVIQFYKKMQNQWEIVTSVLLRIILRKKLDKNSILSIIKCLEDNMETEIAIYRLWKRLINNSSGGQEDGIFLGEQR